MQRKKQENRKYELKLQLFLLSLLLFIPFQVWEIENDTQDTLLITTYLTILTKSF